MLHQHQSNYYRVCRRVLLGVIRDLLLARASYSAHNTSLFKACWSQRYEQSVMFQPAGCIMTCAERMMVCSNKAKICMRVAAWDEKLKILILLSELCDCRCLLSNPNKSSQQTVPRVLLPWSLSIKQKKQNLILTLRKCTNSSYSQWCRSGHSHGREDMSSVGSLFVSISRDRVVAMREDGVPVWETQQGNSTYYYYYYYCSVAFNFIMCIFALRQTEEHDTRVWTHTAFIVLWWHMYHVFLHFLYP